MRRSKLGVSRFLGHSVISDIREIVLMDGVSASLPLFYLVGISSIFYCHFPDKVSEVIIYSSSTLCYAMLCYAMLCYAMLCYAMLCYAMLCYAMLCYDMLCYAMLCYAMLCYALLCYDMI